MASTFQNRIENTPTETLQGIGIVVAACAVIPGLDAIGKILVTEHGLSVGEVSLYRFVLQVALTLPLGFAFEGAMVLRSPHTGLNLLRGVCLGVTGLCLLGGLRFMPLGDTIAIFLINPMILTLFSALFLKEQVGWRRVAAVMVGFAGALVIIRPSYAVFGPAALLPAFAAAFIAIYLILSRQASRGATPMAMQFWAGLGASIVILGAMGLGHPLSVAELSFHIPESAVAIALILTTGVFGTAAHLLFVAAYKRAPASVLAPFGYVEIVSAVLLGFILFGELPDAPKWFGMAVIVGSGIYIFWREQRTARVTPRTDVPKPPAMH
ncbi:DMT family transporter [Afifella sp. IM 167]|uniref:DMT family transporter n=1 Tax=Afifella sp. IM 167 TaxID=2033586 RepID=UPI001CCEDEB0|nr:DMT family transporter [Afifella sp. IM 167]MBZ8134575.1 EamA family transporter [Afifella sp. IM 167]